MKARQLFGIARRYSITWRQGYLSGFLSLLSVLGLVLAIALLILVLSVMNGFDREMRENILALVPHLTIRSWQPLPDWEGQARQIGAHPAVLSVAPFVELQAMLVRDKGIDTTLVQGVDIDSGRAPAGLRGALSAGDLAAFGAADNAVLLGGELARRLGVERGDPLTLIVPAPEGSRQAARFEVLQLTGILNSGTELDESLAVMHLARAASLSGKPGRVDGFRVQLRDLFQAPRVGRELINTLPPGYYASDWTRTHGNLYAAIQMSRDLVGVLLLSIIAIAAFNLVSSLVLVVVDKRSDIAILRALGARPRDINGIFLLQGLLIALVGTAAGTVLGVCASLTVTDVVALLEGWLDIRFLDTDVYPIGYLPSDLRTGDLLVINGVAILLCFLAALYPARRAAKLPPAEALRHE
jgi:lipoprotein-releasing system permease protein